MRTLTLLICLALAFNSFAQDQKAEDTTHLKSIQDLSFMNGTWKGNGWIFTRTGRKEFEQTETIGYKVDEKILVVDGIGYAKEGPKILDKVIHNAFGVISFNQEMNKITMLSFASTGGKMENEMKLTGEKTLEWQFKSDQGAFIRFKEDFSDDGIWVEKGEYSMDGTNWTQFFQMSLKRQ